MSNPGTNIIYDTNTLIGVVPNLKRAQKFMLDRFYTGQADPTSEYVSIDVDIGLRRMAPFVSPLVEGKLVEQRRMQTNTFKPAYIKDKRAPDLLKATRRMIGERIGGGDLSPQERAMANIQFEMEDQVDMVDRRLEWMAVSELLTGQVVVAGDGFDTVTVDFGRAAGLTITLTSGARWGETNVSPVNDVETWALAVLKSSGAVTTDLVFDTLSWNLFSADDKLKGAIYYPGIGVGAQGNNINIGTQVKQGAIYKGRWGNYDLWVYNDWYIDANNVEQPMLPPYSVVLSGPDVLLGTRAFGMIMDPRHNFASLAYAPKTWIRDDPAQQLMMMQSSPLPVPGRPNASLGATVR